MKCELNTGTRLIPVCTFAFALRNVYENLHRGRQQAVAEEGLIDDGLPVDEALVKLLVYIGKSQRWKSSSFTPNVDGSA